MAVRIPIITVFDSKGLKAAQYQLNKVRGNFQNLGRNAAIAGVGIGAVALGLSKSVQAAAEAQRIMAQTESVLRSTGTTANGTAQEIANLSETLSRQTAVDDELIQSGANLLLTFKNIQNQAGENNDIFDQTLAATLDVARAMGTDASGEAIRLGKALNDPVRGISALTRVGIQFTAQQREQIKALTESGDLLGAQKIILAELQSQFGGSAQAYAQTFAGQVELLGIELENLSEEIGVIVMPALRSLMEGLREMAPEIGSNLRDAVNSVDWKSLAKTLIDLAGFFLRNAEAIIRVSVALFALNTAYNALKVAQGLYNAVAAFTNTLLQQTGTVATTTTRAVGLLRNALFLGGVTVAVGSVVDEYRRLKDAIKNSKIQLSQFDSEVIATSGAVAKLSPINTLWQNITKSILGAVMAQRDFNGETKKPDLSGYMDAGERRNRLDVQFRQSGMERFAASLVDTTKNTGAGATTSSRAPTFAQTLRQGVVAQNRLTKLVGTGLSEGAAQLALSRVDNKKQFTKLITNLSKPGVADKRQAVFNRTAAGIAELAQIRANNEAINAQNLADQQEADRQRQAVIDAEKAAADERERIYKSFADSVTSTFARIKDAIVGAFSLPELGGSTDSIIRNMDKLLTRVRAFSANITKLSTMGLDPALLQQVIQAGPVAGARLAAGLVAGGAEALGRINAGFGEIQTLGSELGMTGTQSRFNNATQQNIYNINVEGGVGSGATIGKAIVDAIKAYERTSGAVWQGA